MNTATLLAALSLFVFTLKILMVWSRTNFAGNPVWQAISFLNSSLLYPWFIWGGYQFSESLREKNVRTVHDLNKDYQLELQKELSKRYEVERKLQGVFLEVEHLRRDHQSELRELKLSFEKASRTAADANDQALRSLL